MFISTQCVPGNRCQGRASRLSVTCSQQRLVFLLDPSPVQSLSEKLFGNETKKTIALDERSGSRHAVGSRVQAFEDPIDVLLIQHRTHTRWYFKCETFEG